MNRMHQIIIQPHIISALVIINAVLNINFVTSIILNILLLIPTVHVVCRELTSNVKLKLNFATKSQIRSLLCRIYSETRSDVSGV